MPVVMTVAVCALVGSSNSITVSGICGQCLHGIDSDVFLTDIGGSNGFHCCLPTDPLQCHCWVVGTWS